MNQKPQSLTAWSKLIHSANQRQCPMNNKETKGSYKLDKIQTFLWASQQNGWFENILKKFWNDDITVMDRVPDKKNYNVKSGWKFSCPKNMSLRHKKVQKKK